jgi:hypothetical protein
MGKRNTIHQHLEAMHRTESLIKITGCTMGKTPHKKNCADTNKRHENKKAKGGKPTHCQQPTLS